MNKWILAHRHARVRAGNLAYELADERDPWKPALDPVLFIHGIGLHPRAWGPIARQFLAERPVLLAHLHGHGESAGLLPGVTDTAIDVAGDFETLLQQEGIHRVHVVGESIGGTLALALAIRRPDMVASLSVLSTGFRGAAINGLDTWRGFIGEQGVRAWSEMMIDRRFVDGAVDPDVLRWVAEVQESLAADAIISCGEMLLRTDITAELARVATPTLVIAPTASPFLGTLMPAQLAALLPNARFLEAVGAKHGVVLSHGEFCAAAISKHVGTYRGLAA